MDVMYLVKYYEWGILLDLFILHLAGWFLDVLFLAMVSC